MEQTSNACRTVADDPAIHQRVLGRVLRRADEFSFDRSPPEMWREIHRIVRKETGDTDPYRKVKIRDNEFALRLLPGLRELVAVAERNYILDTDGPGLIQLFMFDILTVLIIWLCRCLITLQETRWYLLHKLLNSPWFRTWFDKIMRNNRLRVHSNAVSAKVKNRTADV